MHLWICFMFATSGLVSYTSGQMVIPDEVPLERMSPYNCQQYPVTGNCHSQLVRYYYNVSSGHCEPFAYSGCGGNQNRFSSYPECFASCVCAQPAFVSACAPSTANQIYFDTMSGECSRLPQEMCQQNGNIFSTVSECHSKCSLCDLAADSGPCTENSVRYFFDRKMGRCVKFRYGGCGGNANNFNTLGACSTKCKTSSASLREKFNPGTTSLPRTHVMAHDSLTLPVFGRQGRISQVAVPSRKTPTHQQTPNNNHDAGFVASHGLAVFNENLRFQTSNLLYEAPEFEVVPIPRPEVTQAPIATTLPPVYPKAITDPPQRFLRLRLKFARPLGHAPSQTEPVTHHQAGAEIQNHSGHRVFNHNTGSSFTRGTKNNQDAGQPTRMTSNGHSAHFTVQPTQQMSKSTVSSTQVQRVKTASTVADTALKTFSGHQDSTANPGSSHGSILITGPLKPYTLKPPMPDSQTAQGQSHERVTSLSQSKHSSNVSPKGSQSKIPTGHMTTHGLGTPGHDTTSRLLALANKLLAVTNVLKEVVGVAPTPKTNKHVQIGTLVTSKPTHPTTVKGGSAGAHVDQIRTATVNEPARIQTVARKSVQSQKVQTGNISGGRPVGSKIHTATNKISVVDSVQKHVGEKIISGGEPIAIHPLLPMRRPQISPHHQHNSRHAGSEVHSRRQPHGNQSPYSRGNQPLILGPLAPQTWDWMRQRHLQQHQQHHQHHRQATAMTPMRQPGITSRHPTGSSPTSKHAYPSTRIIPRNQPRPSTIHSLANSIPAKYLPPKTHSFRSHIPLQTHNQWHQRTGMKPRNGRAPIHQWSPKPSNENPLNTEPNEAQPQRQPQPEDPALSPDQYMDAMDAAMLAGLL